LYLEGQVVKETTEEIEEKNRQLEQKTAQLEEQSEYADYIALINGKRNLPWRVLVIADDDADLVTGEIIYRLAKPLQIKDTSWIKPGKVAWDWWNFNNIYGVDFAA
jgi:alpha-glucosidase